MTHRYHEGELEAQECAGVRDRADKTGASIRTHMPDAAISFVASTRMLVIASVDTHGHPWATVTAGPPGFVQVLDNRNVRIHWPGYRDERMVANLQPGAAIGLLVPDFTTRRRARLNGRITRTSPNSADVHTEEVYSNCPKYIQRRDIDASEARASTPIARYAPELNDEQRDWIRRADTFFVATAHPKRGADASHRGGMPGFVEVEGNRLTWPDYRGNSMFNTLGNLVVNPHASLAFLNFETGSTLQLSGRAYVDWRAGSAAGAERTLTFDVGEVVEVRGGVPIKMTLVDYSPVLPTRSPID